MSPPEVQPVRRRPGRPRKNPAAAAQSKPSVEPSDSAETYPVGFVPEPSDERIGQQVDPVWHTVAFPDGSQYRVEDGVIVERVR